MICLIFLFRWDYIDYISRFECVLNQKCVCVFRVSWWWRASGAYGRASRLSSPSRGRVKVWSRSGSRGPAGAHARVVTDAQKGRPHPSSANQRETGEWAEHDGICSLICFQLSTIHIVLCRFCINEMPQGSAVGSTLNGILRTNVLIHL